MKAAGLEAPNVEEAEVIEFIKGRVMQPMAKYTFPYVASILGVIDEDRGWHGGSALRCVLSDRRAVVTALHVIEKARADYPRIAVSAGHGVTPYELQGEPDLTDRERDLAIYFLGNDYPAESERVAFWPEQRIERGEEKRSTDYLFFHGFPGARSELVPLSGVKSLSFPYGVMQRDDLLIPVDPYEFAVDFDPSNFWEDTGDLADFVNPEGMSGCPVWRIGASGRSAQSWSPEHCWLVGIATWWDKKEMLLGATAASRVLDLATTLAHP